MPNLNNLQQTETALVTLVNDYWDDTDMYLYEDDYMKISFYLYSEIKLDRILKELKFKKKGKMSDYGELIEEETTITDRDIYINFDKVDRLAVSKKYNAVIDYSVYDRYIFVYCLVTKESYKKFHKKLSEILIMADGSGLFTGYDFKHKKGEYIEISDVVNKGDDKIAINVNEVNKENLVFINGSDIHEVMGDINLFFKKDTKSIYDKLNIAYKRGIILYGQPGNGKTAMIREVIRSLEGVTIVNIVPNTRDIPFILSELIKALNKRSALIVIEDIDAILTKFNRSEFLNVLDGINVGSGIYFIGTTNYPERIDPAFVNRSGRFDRMFEIKNPNEDVRREFFKSSKLKEVLSGYKKYKNDSENKDLSVIDLFVKFSDGLSMANLKELMVSTKYALVFDDSKSIEECLETTYNKLTTSREEHCEQFNNYQNRRSSYRNYDNDFDDDYED